MEWGDGARKINIKLARRMAWNAKANREFQIT